MGHSGHHHAGDLNRADSRRRLTLVLVLTAVFAVAELAGGILTGSLALIADAGHMLSDSASLLLALVAVWLAGRPTSDTRTFGFQRAEILAALVNGIALVAISAWIFYEAVGRLPDPPDVDAGPMLAIAALGLGVNLLAARILMRAAGKSLNMQAAYRHVLADLLASVGVIVAAGVILATDWLEADPIVSIVVGLLILASAWGVIRDSGRVLMEVAPEGLDARTIGERMAAVEGVVEVHDLHIWTITSGFPALSAHVIVEHDDDCHQRRLELGEMLRVEYGLDHTTLQVDHEERPGLLQLDS
ncbi:MAG: cation diffusion facilitator family transporter [Actinomycetota bacterium]|nr:cation diffusion facilitator family transporter [Actinomycetota bacterium]